MTVDHRGNPVKQSSGVGLMTVDALDPSNAKGPASGLEYKSGSPRVKVDSRQPLLTTHPTGQFYDAKPRSAYDLAAFHLLNAIDGKKRRPPRKGSKVAHKFASIHYKQQQNLKWLAMSALLLTVFERPDWCLSGGGERTGLCENSLYPSYHIPYLSDFADVTIECVLVGIMLVDTLAILYANGSGYDCLRLVFLALNCVDIFFYNTVPDNWYRLAAYIRLGYVYSYLPDVQTGMELVMSTLPAIGKILVLLGAFIGFFAWLGVILFPADTKEGQMYFPDLFGGMWQLLILITTANYPDVMMPAYSAHRAAFIFFLFFLLFGFFFLVNLLTAAVFTCYQSHEEDQEKDAAKRREENLEIAFDHLKSADGEISLETMLDFFQVLNSFHLTAHISQPDALDMVSKLNEDGEGGIAMEEWEKLFAVLEHRFENYAPPPYLELIFPQLKTSRYWHTLRRVSHHPIFDGVIDLILIFSVVITAAETWESIMGLPLSMASMKKYAWLDTSFCIIFFVEVTTKALTEGFWKYWKEVKHRFDFIITMAMVVTAFGGADPVIAKYVALLRIFRLIRLLLHVKAYESIAATFGQMLPQAVKVTKVLICFMYLFSVAGVQLFGGLITCDKSSPYYEKVCDLDGDNDFAQGGYYPNNFNDIPSAMVVLFELLIVNNWFVISDGFTVTFGFSSRVYFLVFYIVGIVVVLNIVVASVLNTYSAIEEERNKAEMETQVSTGTEAAEEAAQKWVTEQVQNQKCTWRDLKQLIEPR